MPPPPPLPPATPRRCRQQPRVATADSTQADRITATLAAYLREVHTCARHVGKTPAVGGGGRSRRRRPEQAAAAGTLGMPAQAAAALSQSSTSRTSPPFFNSPPGQRSGTISALMTAWEAEPQPLGSPARQLLLGQSAAVKLPPGQGCGWAAAPAARDISWVGGRIGTRQRQRQTLAAALEGLAAPAGGDKRPAPAAGALRRTCQEKQHAKADGGGHGSGPRCECWSGVWKAWLAQRGGVLGLLGITACTQRVGTAKSAAVPLARKAPGGSARIARSAAVARPDPAAKTLACSPESSDLSIASLPGFQLPLMPCSS